MEIVKFVNLMFTPVSLVLSLMVVYYAVLAYKNLRVEKNKPVARSLVAIGIMFSTFSIYTVVIYACSYLTDTGIGHHLSTIRSLFTNIRIVDISILMIKIYKEEV